MRVLINSMPKSGTNLLARVVRLLGYSLLPETLGPLSKLAARLGCGTPPSLISENARRNLRRRLTAGRGPEGQRIEIGVTRPVPVASSIVRGWLRSVPPGCAITGHVPWSDALDAMLPDLGYRHLLIVRDPRDVLVSLLHYITERPHLLRPHFEPLSAEERISLAFDGGSPRGGGASILGLKDGTRSVLRWNRSDHCSIIRFEDLIGEQGGGSSAGQRECVRALSRVLEVPLDEGALTEVCELAFDPSSRTFRQGQIGSWKTELAGEKLAPIRAEMDRLLEELDQIKPLGRPAYPG